ncbi:MGMT family protein [Candidatus Saccharibacteria bacterium]|nr:MGMT family protein [Candidatus Saccharibacteria bacterium]
MTPPNTLPAPTELQKLPLSEAVYIVCALIPRGKVATYGQIAFLIGRPKASRAVGGALHRNPNPETTPCHRVVNRAGRLAPNFAFDGPEEQAARLIAEGVEVVNLYVDLDCYLWRP